MARAANGDFGGRAHPTPPMQYPYLISKWMDPVFAVAIGVASYYTFEKRSGRPAGHTLNELVQRKYKTWIE